MINYDNWKLSIPESEKPLTTCYQCEEGIYEGEDVYKVEDGYVHMDDCFDDYAREVLIENVHYCVTKGEIV